jgi:5-methylcytosine-specific restriction endonuclease McrA
VAITRETGERGGNSPLFKEVEMQRVLVVDKNNTPLMPCHPSRARKMLNKKRAVIIRCYPFTIMILERSGGDLQPTELKIDPGSRTTGIAIVISGQRGKKAVWVANLTHRGLAIREKLDARRAIRRGRRNRKTRYRKPRFLNRTRVDGWLPPSLKSRVDNVSSWAKKLSCLLPLTEISIETVRFDTQKLENPEISGVEYSQGTLLGYEIREYLLEKWNRQCAYCGEEGIPLEIDHIIPRSKGGSNRTSNLTLACRICNEKKSNHSIESFLKNKQDRLRKLLANSKKSLKDAAAVNATRYATGDSIRSLGIPTSFWSGGQTKFNRRNQNYEKDHWIDAACVGITGESVYLSPLLKPILIKAMGRGSRQMCRVNRYGFPRTSAKRFKRVMGFQTGDIVKASVKTGKKSGDYQGRVAVRSSGSFNIRTDTSTIQGVHGRYCHCLHRCDGYEYQNSKTEAALPPRPKEVFAKIGL